MDDPQRYFPVHKDAMVADEDGTYVKFADYDALKKQLPDGMEHCTILFKSCKLGHGWLTATNWVQRDCPTCERNAMKADKEKAERERDHVINKCLAPSSIAGGVIVVNPCNFHVRDCTWYPTREAAVEALMKGCE